MGSGDNVNQKKSAQLCGVALYMVACGVAAQDIAPETRPLASDDAGVAQSQAGTGETSTDASAPPAGTATGSDAAQLDDVVVTANKRVEPLQEVPQSIAVIDDKQLDRQNISEVTELVRATPTVNIPGPLGPVSIRGIGALSFARSSEGSVGVVVDNISLAGMSNAPPQLFDVERVEVLTGPQGTLFGRNSSGGVINITTNAPQVGLFEALAGVDYGSRDMKRGRAMVNVPVSQQSALRIAATYGWQPDVSENINDGGSYQLRQGSARVRYLWNATPDVTFNLLTDFTQNHHDGGTGWAVYKVTPGSELANALAACGVAVGPDNSQTCVDTPALETTTVAGVSPQLDIAFGDYTLTSVTGYRTARNDLERNDVDSTNVYVLNQFQDSDSQNLSQELRLASPKSDTGDYVAGIYYFNSKFDGSTSLLGPIAQYQGVPFPLGQTIDTETKQDSIATFAQGTYYVVPKVGLTAGVRLGRENVEAHTRGRTADGAAGSFGSTDPVDGDVSDTYFTWRVGAKYQATDDLMVYASQARGYKGPAINDQGNFAGAKLVINPEIPDASELGLKTSFFKGRLLLDGALFYTKVKDFQAQTFDAAANTFVYSNVPSVTSKGGEVLLLGRALDGLTLTGGVGYTDVTIGNGWLVPCRQPAAANCTVDAGGNQLAGAPKWKVTTSGEYAFPLMGLEAFGQLDAVYTSVIYSDNTEDPVRQLDAATILGARMGVRSPSGAWSVSAFARNLTDEFRPVWRFDTPTGPNQNDPASESQILGPETQRYFGLSVEARWY